MLTQSIQGLTGRSIRCILFDLGDTLWYRKDVTAWQHLEAISNQRAALSLRTCVAPALLPTTDDTDLGARLRKALEGQVRVMIRQNPEIEPDGPLIIVQVLRQWGIKHIEREVGEKIFEALRIRIPESRPLFQDVLPTLDALQQRGFQLGVVTNRLWGGPLFQEDLHQIGLLNYFDPLNIAASGDLGVRKPNPAIFFHVLNHLQIPPEHVVMVGDSLRADIIGGQRIGIFSIWKPKPAWLDQINALLGQHGTPAELSPDEFGESLMTGVHVTDDDYVLAQVQNRNSSLDAWIRGEIKPDLVIETLSDLLHIFSKAAASGGR